MISVTTSPFRFGCSVRLGWLRQVPFTFATASLIAERLSASAPARCKVVSNEFKSRLATAQVETWRVGWDPKKKLETLIQSQKETKRDGNETYEITLVVFCFDDIFSLDMYIFV